MIISGSRNGSTSNIKSTAIKIVLSAAIVFALLAVALNVFFSGHQSTIGQPTGQQAQIEGQANEKPADEDQIEPADNYYCFVCHINFQDEELSLAHQLAGVGCEDCHGQSKEHSSDEDGITPPEIMYSADKINPFCTTCHKPEELILTEDHESLFTETDEQSESCTKCHGKHFIEVRTRRWDKNTRQLIWDDGVRMMKNPDEQQQ